LVSAAWISTNAAEEVAKTIMSDFLNADFRCPCEESIIRILG
jgi:hypothetical protein